MKKIILFFYFLIFTSSCCFSQNVGIGTANPAAKLHTVGSVRFDTLGGSGIRPVFADASGNITATTPSLPPSTVTNPSGSAIPDFSCVGTGGNIVLSQLPSTVSSSGIKVTLNITHPKLQDLTIYLTAPNGSVINLFKTSNAGAANLVNTVFTDAGVALTAGTAPYTGSYKPAGDLSPSICGIAPNVTTFSAIGSGTINPNGTWVLKVIDNTSTSTGTLNNWTLSVDPGDGPAGIWSLKGNTGTNQYNFIGTVDNAPLNFRVNNQKAGIIDSALFNTGFGYRSLESATIGNGNVGFGYKALRNNTTGYSNIAIGRGALFNNVTGHNLIAIGDSALFSEIDSGVDGLYGGNLAIGSKALRNNITGSYNTAIGYESLYSGNGDLFFQNTAIGYQALKFNTAYWNTAIGCNAGASNTSGSQNTAIGFDAMKDNTVGIVNTAVGSSALASNTWGSHNTAVGSAALAFQTTGSQNTGIGFNALIANETGSLNTATGYSAMSNNITGFYNTGVGAFALYSTDASQYNTAIGYRAGDTYNNGFNNVFVGANTDVAGAGYYNVIAIGQGTVVSAVNTARFGNAATVSYGGWSTWTNVSDGRYKENIKENVPGLAFINKLRPVTYNLAARSLDAFLHRNSKDEMSGVSKELYENALKEKEKITYTGFVAQEVEAVAKELGFDFSGVDKPKSDNDTYGLRYAEFVVPLVKGMQEQQKTIEDLQKRITLLEEQNKLLIQLLNKK